MTIEIVSPTPEADGRLRAEFAASAADWKRKSDEANERGNAEVAYVYEVVARVADDVAKGGAP